MKEFEPVMQAGMTLVKVEPEGSLGSKVHIYFRSRVGKLLQLMRLSAPEVINSVRETSKQITNPVGNHAKAMR